MGDANHISTETKLKLLPNSIYYKFCPKDTIQLNLTISEILPGNKSLAPTFEISAPDHYIACEPLTISLIEANYFGKSVDF